MAVIVSGMCCDSHGQPVACVPQPPLAAHQPPLSHGLIWMQACSSQSRVDDNTTCHLTIKAKVLISTGTLPCSHSRSYSDCTGHQNLQKGVKIQGNKTTAFSFIPLIGCPRISFPPPPNQSSTIFSPYSSLDKSTCQHCNLHASLIH